MNDSILNINIQVIYFKNIPNIHDRSFCVFCFLLLADGVKGRQDVFWKIVLDIFDTPPVNPSFPQENHCTSIVINQGLLQPWALKWFCHMLVFMGSQRVGHDWATELNWLNWYPSTACQVALVVKKVKV